MTAPSRLLRPQPTHAGELVGMETSWKPGLRTSCELVSNYTVFHKKHPLRLFIISLLNCGQFFIKIAEPSLQSMCILIQP